ncbi:MAG: gliding motility-associated C-terminal domain-containing protein [Candidatus Latescibacteria bacterium]|nr:gliding motility-associated C-terminal domain-containing protein [Candidatus Latescibacterota bacterium]
MKIRGALTPLVLGVVGVLGLLVHGVGASSRTIVMGGEGGLLWKDGGGTIKAAVETAPNQVEVGITPANVIDFNLDGRSGWIFPQRADETKNIALGLLDRGGRLSSPTILESGIEASLALMVDNKGATAFERKSISGVRQVNAFGVYFDFDLGARFGVSRIQFFPRNAHPDYLDSDNPFQNDYLRAYELFLNDGSEETQIEGRPAMTSYKLELQNDEPVVDLRIPPQYVRYLRLKSQTVIDFEIAEFQVFGVGFVPEAIYVSNIFDLGSQLALWGNIRWLEEHLGRERMSRVHISTRSGLDDTPLVYNRIDTESGLGVPWKEGSVVTTAEGLQVKLDEALGAPEALALFRKLPLEEKNRVALTLADYLALGGKKGEVEDDLEAWSPWSPPYSPAGVAITAENLGDSQLGVPIVSPGPRRYLQFEAEFMSEDLAAATGLGGLSFTVSGPPVAQELLGEISPRSTELGVPTTFTYAVLPTLVKPRIDTGFDVFEISTPVRAEAVEEIQVTFPDGQVRSADFSAADLQALPLADASGDFGIEAVDDHRLRVRFPMIGASDLGTGKTALLKIRFRCRVLRYGTKFAGTAWNAAAGDVGQGVIAGNAFRFAEQDDDLLPVGSPTQRGLSVDVPLSGVGEKMLINARAVPRPFTPNQDGINDRASIVYDIARLVGGAPVRIEIFDLAGLQVRQLLAATQESGSFAVPWDGKDGQGRLLPPGIYIYRITLDSDIRGETVVGTVEMVY